MSLRQRPTIEEFLQGPDERPYREMIHGTVRRKAMPDFPHSYLQTRVATCLDTWSGVGGWTLTEQRCILEAGGESHVVLPDVAWFSVEQLPAPTAGPGRVDPVLAVEILSPRDRFTEVQDKVMLHLDAGVQVVWVVDPVGRRVTVYRPGSAPEVVKQPASLQDRRLSGLQIPLAELFARLPIPETSQPDLRE